MVQKEKITVVLADDHELYLEGLKRFFETQEIYEIIGEALNGRDLVSLVKRDTPQIVLTDLRMPLMNGSDAIKMINQINSSIKCIILTSFENDYSIVEAMESGAMGYIVKNMPKSELFEALNHVQNGHPYYCISTNKKMTRLLAKSQFNPYLKENSIQFSETERKIIQLICEDKRTEEMSDLLCISKRTIENNRFKILKKINARTAVGITIYAIKTGLHIIKD